MFDQKAFLLLKNTFHDCFKLNVCYFTDWQGDITQIDKELRTHFTDPESHYQVFCSLLCPLLPQEIITLKDTLQLRYVLIRGTGLRDFYAIGPYRTHPLTEKETAAILRSNQMDSGSAELLMEFVSQIPNDLKQLAAIAVARNLLDSFYDTLSPGIREIDLNVSQAPTAPIVSLEDLNARSKRIEEIYEHEDKLRGYVAQGNFQKALQEGLFFSQSGLDRKLPQTSLSHRSYFYAANTLLRLTAQSMNIHPVYQDEISQKFARKIALCNTSSQLSDTYVQMIREYCQLCREHSMKAYNPNTQTIVNYILLNLSSDLSAKVVGTATGFSPGYVSRLIKEDSGMTLNQFITQERIRVAKRLLVNSPTSISDIAVHIGIPDWNYFTKLFKKVEGCTPSEYRRQHRLTTK